MATAPPFGLPNQGRQPVQNFSFGQVEGGAPQQTQFGGFTPPPNLGFAPPQPTQAPLVRQAPSGPGGTLQPGDPHPFLPGPSVNQGLISPPPLPGPGFTDQFIPPVLLNPFLGGINAAAQMGSFASQAAPMAGMFQQGLYSPGLNPMEQAFLGSSGALGMRGLESAFNRIDAQYENAPMASTRFRQMTDAGNQFAEQMANIGSQMGLQRQSIATQNLPFAFGFPLQASEAGQGAAGDLLNLAEQAVTGPLDFPLAAYQSYPVIPPSIIQPPSTSGGKK